MNKKLPILGLLAIFISLSSFSQRYVTEMFTDVTVSSDIKYGENYSVLTGSPVLSDLMMDVYEPDGDVATDRYLIILMHAGSYLPKGVNTLPFGNRKDSAMVELCTQFAKRGWVAVSMDYRLGWNPTPDAGGGNQETRAKTIMNAVYRSMQDAKTCIRYFRKDHAENSNSYGIDPTRIAIGGSNSGGYTALAVATLNKVPEIQYPKFLDGTSNPFIDITTIGGFDGQGGATGLNIVNHPGYASNAQLVLNLGGAIGDTMWLESGEAPIVSFHGVADPLTPYKTAVVTVAATGDQIVEVSGSYNVSSYANALNINDVFNTVTGDAYTTVAESRSSYDGLFPFPGAANGFEPWAWYDDTDPNIDNTTPGATGFGSKANPFASKTKALAYIDTIMGYFNPRAVAAMQTPIPLQNPLGIGEPTHHASELSLYPNPVKENLFVSSNNDRINRVVLTDITGKIVYEQQNLSTNRFKLERSEQMRSGVYLLSITMQDKVITKRVVLE